MGKELIKNRDHLEFIQGHEFTQNNYIGLFVFVYTVLRSPIQLRPYLPQYLLNSPSTIKRTPVSPP